MTKMMTLRFQGRKQEMTHPVPREEEGDLHRVPREVVVAILLDEMTTIAGIVMVSFTAAADMAVTNLLHQEGEDQEEMNCGMQGQGPTLLFQGVSQVLELHPNIQSTDLITPATMIEPKTYLIEPEILTLPGGTMRGTPRMMLKQHHQRPPRDPGQSAEVREIIPGHQKGVL